MRASGTSWVLSVGSRWLSTGLLTSCGGSTTPPAEPERVVRVAQPCRGLELGSDPLDPAKARIFVEVVEVSARQLPQPVGTWLRENTVTVRSTVNLVAFPDVPISMPWGQCVDAVCASMNRSITLTARLPRLASDPFELAVRIDEAAPEGEGASPRVLLDTTVQALNQQPVVVPPVAALSDGTVVVTAYLLRRPDDLQRVMECQAPQKETTAK
jgi:hypothetical protein